MERQKSDNESGLDSINLRLDPKNTARVDIYTSRRLRDFLRLDDVLRPPRMALALLPASSLPINPRIRTRKPSLFFSEGTQTAQRWMSDCLSGHERCRELNQSPSSPPFYPTRLLELSDLTVRLIDSAVAKPTGPYVALSYCWGPNPSFLRLSDLNASELEGGIPFSNLPIAFQEAIRFIKGFSIHYLWIDCLCIIQSGKGSAEDWKRESVKMGEVYSKSIFTLALSRAANPNQSCLGGWTPDVLPPFEVETTGLYNRDKSTKTTKTTCTVIDRSYFYKALYNQPLSHRAWVLQERLLAPRVISFGLGELFWECAQLPIASESLPCGLGVHSNQMEIVPKSMLDTSDRSSLEHVWWNIVMDYTNRKLTFPEKDKLVALSAVATQMSRIMDDVYVAGHFWKRLPYTLNWTNAGLQARRIAGSAKTYKFPSWSWASMDGILNFDTVLNRGNLYGSAVIRECFAEAESYTIAPICEANPVGQMAFATLKIRAPTDETRWGPGTFVPEALQVPYGGPRVHMDDPDEKLENGSRLLLAYLCLDTDRSVKGLILRKLEIGGIEVYERLGHFNFSVLTGEYYIREKVKIVLTLV